jgi:hypothetical protein
MPQQCSGTTILLILFSRDLSLKSLPEVNMIAVTKAVKTVRAPKSLYVDSFMQSLARPHTSDIYVSKSPAAPLS